MNDSIIPKRTCTKCGLEFPETAEYFTPDKRYRGGLKTWCRNCVRAYNRKWDHEHPEHWQNQGRERARVRYKRYYENNTERILARKRRLRKENPSRYALIEKRYKQRHPEKIRQHSHNRRSRLNGVEGTYDLAEIKAQYKRQKGRCYYAACGHCKLGDDYQIEHVIPVTRKGARNDMSNIVLVCRHCNASKGNKLPHEWPEGGKLL